jgi:excisionase family DNA binding protein
MNGQLEAAERELLKSVLREVIRDVMPPRQTLALPPNNSVMPAEDKMLLTVGETAKVRSISERTLFKLTATGQLPCVKLDRLVRYNLDTLHEWIEQNESTAKPKRAQRREPPSSTKPSNVG